MSQRFNRGFFGFCLVHAAGVQASFIPERIRRSHVQKVKRDSQNKNATAASEVSGSSYASAFAKVRLAMTYTGIVLHFKLRIVNHTIGNRAS